MTTEEKRILDDMLKRRVDAARRTDEGEVEAIAGCVAKGIMDATRLRPAKSNGEIEAGVIQQILASLFGVTDDSFLIVDNDGTKVDARTIRVWASFYLTPEQTQ